MSHPAPLAVLDAVRRDDAASVAVALLQLPQLADHHAPGGESLVLHALYHEARTVLPTLIATRTLPAVEAAALGNLDALDRALERSPRAIGAMSGDGWTPLHLAAYFAEHEAVRRLLAAGASLAAISRNALANTPLHAAISGKADVVTVGLLLETGADVNARAARDITPLHLAASRGAEDVAERLLAAGADRTAAMDEGTTPAALAAHREFAALAERLRPDA